MSATILILEDDSAFAEMLSETLEANDFVPVVSLDPTEAIEKVRSEKFDLLVSDYLMPKLEGTGFIRKVREFNGSIPVIMISAFMGVAEMQQAAQVGVTRVLKKPFEMGELIDEIKVLLQSGSALADAHASAGPVGGGAVTYPQPLKFLRADTLEGRRWVQSLWEANGSGGPIFVCGDRGFELDPMAAEVAGWNDPDGGTVVFDFEAAELLGGAARSVITRFAGKDRYSNVVVARGLDLLDRSQQRMLAGLLEREDSYLRQGGRMTYLFPVAADRLSLAEMSMDERLLETVMGNLVRVPGLRGRFADIASYLTGPLADSSSPVLHLLPEAAAFLLRYDWPGNYEELIELRIRLAKRWGEHELGLEQVRSALEKRLTRPLDEIPDPSLEEVLRVRQNEILEGIRQSERKNPAQILQMVGAPEGTEPTRTFPHGQDLLFRDLLEAVDGEESQALS